VSETNNSPSDTISTATIYEDMRTLKKEMVEIKTNFNALKEEIKENYSKINISLDKIFRVLSSQEPMHKAQAVAPPKDAVGEANVPGSARTARRPVKETDLRCRSAAKKILLTQSEGKKSFQILDGIVGVMFEVIYLAHNRYTRQKNITFLKDAVLKHAKKRMSRKRKSSTSATTSSTNLIAADDDVAIDQQIDDQDNIDSDGENI
jgi:hypothetical protein